MVSKVQLPHLLALDTVNLFKILAVLIAGWWYCVLKSVSLVIDYSENLSLCLLLFFCLFLIKCLLRSFIHFADGLFVFLLRGVGLL